ncbi:hypothetical protein DPMN_126320, partial [Dreissena polymorpha]
MNLQLHQKERKQGSFIYSDEPVAKQRGTKQMYTVHKSNTYKAKTTKTVFFNTRPFETLYDCSTTITIWSCEDLVAIEMRFNCREVNRVAYGKHHLKIRGMPCFDVNTKLGT